MEMEHAILAMTPPLAVLIAATWLGRRPWAVIAKPVASSVFLVAGMALAPLPNAVGVALVAGLGLSFLGDVLLIPRGRTPAFALGLASFLAAHVAYAAAFLLHGVAPMGILVATVALVALGAPLARWLLSHVRGALRGPVLGYITAITAMVVLASGAVAHGARPVLLVGAALFYASDLFVARERFVARSRWNGTVGLPLYYAAQLCLIEGLRDG